MTVKGNRNISRWSLDHGYGFRFGHKDEYLTRLTIPIVVNYFVLVLSMEKQNFAHRCNPSGRGFKLILAPPGEVLKMSRNNFRIHMNKLNHIPYKSKIMTTSDGLRSYSADQRQCFYQSERRLRFFRMYTQANCEEE